jgi:lipoate-protein ligase A
MRLLDISYPEPARNLALEEALLEGVAAGRAPDTLRLWESPVPFVVIGSSQQLRFVANEFNCARDGVPILRRCSAGGAVLQGPGSLNFALALSYDRFPEVAALHASYAFLLDKVAAALAGLGLAVERQGISDLAIEGMKCSGNAQRRKRNACLHHGTLLYRVDPGVMGRYLPEPGERPEYRGGRVHEEFVRAAAATPEALRGAVRQAFCPDALPGVLLPKEEEMVALLTREKYGTRAWNYRR